MITEVKNTIQKYSLLTKGDKVLLAVSGGVDSVSMAHIFNKLEKDFQIIIAIAYFHHGLRKEADRELEVVKRLAQDFGVPFYWERKDVLKIVKQKKASIEEVAREQRYNFLIQIAKKNGYSKIAVAHNKDDQVETFLHRLLRGAGLRGLRGILPIIEIQGVKIIRPLIECSRGEIESYLKKLGATVCIDSSNYEIKFTRNRIRHELLPYLEGKFNPNLKKVLYNTVLNIQSAYGFIENEVKEGIKRCVKKNDSYVKINRDRFRKYHPYLKREILRKAIEMVKGNLRKFEYAHWEEIEVLLKERPWGSIVNLPQDIYVKKDKIWIIVGKGEKNGDKR